MLRVQLLATFIHIFLRKDNLLMRAAHGLLAITSILLSDMSPLIDLLINVIIVLHIIGRLYMKWI